MANPQKENGHIRIANEIWEVLSMVRLTQYQWAAIRLVLRMSYGCGQKACQFNNWTDFEACAGIHRTEIKQVLESLQVAQILLIDWRNKVIAFNKDYDSWDIRLSPLFISKRYSNLIKHNLSQRGIIESVREHLLVIGNTYKEIPISDRKHQSGVLGITYRGIRDYLIPDAVDAGCDLSGNALKTVKDNKNNKKARARKESKADIIDDWLHKINLEAGEDIANKGAENYEEMCFILSHYSWEEEVAPAIKEKHEIHFADRLSAVVKQVTGEDYEW